MWEELMVSRPWVFVNEGCSMEYNILDPDEVEFIIRGSGLTVEYAFTSEGLRQFLDIAAKAHQEMRKTESRTWGQSTPDPGHRDGDTVKEFLRTAPDPNPGVLNE